MNQLELSIIVDDKDEQILADLGIDAQIISMHWATYWKDILNIALFRHGADVSQVGAPSTGAVVSMNALRPFTAREIARMGGANTFLPANWQTTQVSGESDVWAVPFVSDVRVIYYWQDMLEKAKIDPQTAFQNPKQFEETLARLQASGITTPWGVETRFPFGNLQNIVSWIWSGGGDILTPDGKEPLFAKPEAMEGIRAFFRLQKYLSPKMYLQDQPVYASELFANREVAVAMGSPNLLRIVRQHYAHQPEKLRNMRVALPPGPPYVGGSNLLVWTHTRLERQAVALVQQLISKEIQSAFCRRSGYLPVRMDVLSEPPYTSDPHLLVIVEALKAGRAYPSLRRWGLVEERLSIAFDHIWVDLFKNPDTNVDATLEQLVILNDRLAITLKEFDDRK
jgi:multiple sugar transport system substrate-binding protein